METSEAMASACLRETTSVEVAERLLAELGAIPYSSPGVLIPARSLAQRLEVTMASPRDGLVGRPLQRSPEPQRSRT